MAREVRDVGFAVMDVLLGFLAASPPDCVLEELVDCRGDETLGLGEDLGNGEGFDVVALDFEDGVVAFVTPGVVGVLGVWVGGVAVGALGEDFVEVPVLREGRFKRALPLENPGFADPFGFEGLEAAVSFFGDLATSADPSFWLISVTVSLGGSESCCFGGFISSPSLVAAGGSASCVVVCATVVFSAFVLSPSPVLAFWPVTVLPAAPETSIPSPS